MLASTTFVSVLAAAIFLAAGRLPGADAAVNAQSLRSLPPNGAPTGWSTFTPRSDIAPIFSVDPRGGRTGGGALKIETRTAADFGGWKTRVNGITGGRTYRFQAWYRGKNVPFERHSIIARIEWLDQKGQAVRPPDYALDSVKENGWTKVEYIAPVPPRTRRAEIQLALGFAAGAAVWWEEMQLTEESSPPNRVVRAVTVYHRPQGTKSALENVNQFCGLAEQAAAQHPDLVCLPEGITVVGTGKSYVDVAEPVPGPTTERLGATAKKLHSYLVAGLYERVGKIVYNTAVLIGRNGELVGTYRKTHLPREEWEKGITPGNEYPVFRTDFGTVGLIICWDLQFPEPSRAMAIKGAEILLLPIWGGTEVLARARAIENSVFLISSTYDMRSYILDPAGKILAEANKTNQIASALLRLDQKIYQPWIGDMKTRTWKERRPDIKLE